MARLIEFLVQPGRSRTWLRRTVTIPSVLLGGSLIWLLAPLGVLLTATADIAHDFPRRPRFIFTRTLAFLAGYLACEAMGLAAAFSLWVLRLILRPTEKRYLFWNFRLQCQWGAALGRVGQAAFGYHFAVTGTEAISPGPILLLLRHTSLADTILAVSQVSRPKGIMLRYVLKRPLLLDPCIDIVGLRLPNTFALRGAKTKAQLDGVARLAQDLGADDGVLIYPEGTRFTPAKKNALIDKLERRGHVEQVNFARSLEHLLPPIRGGVLALLETNAQQSTPADVVFCAHSGFEGSATAKDLLAGELLGRTIRIHFWRVPYDTVPVPAREREQWLRARWQEMDSVITRLAR